MPFVLIVALAMMTMARERRIMEHETNVISIYSKPVLVECYNKLQRRFNQEQNPRKKRAIQRRMDIFASRIAHIEKVLGRRRTK